ncbi:MerR family transcriptional regulator [Uliginosibacterium sediminicola]|uniref:MerR family transcriptional regulator n=1 Tax=Uliginosibacterium sediminicola TaxID=2024550 RepID=A0ABU9YWP6_9RHOO
MSEAAAPSPATPASALFSIAVVERDTGIGKDTLRVWERRYGFPQPLRDEHGERLYPAEQVERLRRIRRLMDLGMRPGKIFAASDSELDSLLQASDSAGAATEAGHELLDLVRLAHSEALRVSLQQRLMKQGLERFVTDTLAPLNVAVGNAWMRGSIEVADEHLYTEHVQNLLRAAIAQRTAVEGAPRILLTTLPEEPHGLGLLMAEALLVSEGAQCVSLGTRTPLADILSAVDSGQFDVLALSFSAAFPQRLASSGLQQLSASLPEHVEIWAGGRGLGPRMPAFPRVRILGEIASVLQVLADWRSRQAH